MAPADGAGRRRDQAPAQTGRTVPVVRLGVQATGSGRVGSGVPGKRAGRVPGIGAGAWPG